MFENLSDKILESLKKIRGQSRITESNIDDTLREIRLSLLDADVNFKAVKSFTEKVKVKALGQSVMTALRPGEHFVKVVHDEMVELLGGDQEPFIDLGSRPSVIFLVGLQGAGKTTTAAKLALFIRQKFGKRVGLVPADVYRPAAIDQLKILGTQNDLSVFSSKVNQKPEEILNSAKRWASDLSLDVLIVDTAGRLQIDEVLMDELVRLKEICPPQEVLLVADAMLGQQSVNVAEGFHQRLGLTGLILTKVDGDSRGGAALSIREVTGVPVKFLGVGEKVTALELFHPDRLAGRILGMGDVLTLAERAQEVVDEKAALASAKKLAKNQFTLEDFLEQMQNLKKMGGFESVLKMLPGMGSLLKQVQSLVPPEKEIKKMEAIIRSMTLQERRDTRVLNGSRRERIARGSGTQVQDVNQLVRQFENSKKMMSSFMKMGGGGFRGGRGGGGGHGLGGGFPGGGFGGGLGGFGGLGGGGGLEGLKGLGGFGGLGGPLGGRGRHRDDEGE